MATKKKEMKVRDLKPAKDAKGGAARSTNTSRQSQSSSRGTNNASRGSANATRSLL